jgi:hypothetical protein
MSDPQRPVGKTPPRAQPLQPDKPGSGRSAESPKPGSAEPPKAENRRETQERDALDNVREGYD